MKRHGLALAALALLGACHASPPSPPVAEAAPPLEALSTKELMAHVVDPAADGVWERQGWELTSDGEHETFPTTDQGWRDAENAAATVAEAANLLLTKERLRPDPVWGEYARALHQAGLDTFRAAQAKNKQAFFDAGGRIYTACTACHERFMTPPNDAAAPPAPASKT